MALKAHLDKILLYFVAGLFIWFFSSSISIAYQKSLQHDDAMFATIPKNFLNGYGWATSYGEKIPFNPDISTGPSLLIPATLMMAIFANTTWVPAMTGAITNILLVILILWQISELIRNRVATALALLLAISLFAVNDFKTFTAYYTCSLLFLFALFFSLNKRHSTTLRFCVYGFLATIGFYGKPLILLSFILALLPLIFFTRPANKIGLRYFSKYSALAIAAFIITATPWQLYKYSVISEYSSEYQSAYHTYAENFFKNHGTGIAQLENAQNKISYLKNNSRKNFRILSKFLAKENNYPAYLVFLVCFSALIFSLKEKIFSYAPERADIPVSNIFSGILAFVIIGNAAWYVLISFAMTPGHTFFLVFFSFFLLFFLLANKIKSGPLAITACLLVVLLFQVRIPPMIEAYSFKAKDDLIDNNGVDNVLAFLKDHPVTYPLASCGYNAAPWRFEYLMPHSQNFVDCFNLLEDSLVADEHQNYHWVGTPNFTLVIDWLTFAGAAKAYSYVLSPVAESCVHHLLYKENVFVVCEVPFAEVVKHLEPNQTTRELTNYQRWYQTRIKTH